MTTKNEAARGLPTYLISTLIFTFTFYFLTTYLVVPVFYHPTFSNVHTTFVHQTYHRIQQLYDNWKLELASSGGSCCILHYSFRLFFFIQFQFAQVLLQIMLLIEKLWKEQI